MKKFFLLKLLCLMMMNYATGQIAENKLEDYQIHIQRSKKPIRLDGILDEQAWNEADIVKGFWMQFPSDVSKAEARTEVKVTYDGEFLYIAAICYDVKEFVVQTLKRDSGFFTGDAFAVVIDPINGHTNGFMFGVSPYNVQSEDLLGPNPPDQDQMTFSWDSRWFSAVSRESDKYIVEMAIPFKTLRFNDENATWGINFFRNDLGRNQFQSWTPLPVNFQLYDLGYTGKLNWDNIPKKTGMNISLLPYVTTGLSADNDTENPKTEGALAAGLDAKIALTSALNLDLTVNPDFSQVDVDVQQTNLTRFNLRFPERRPFFLENNDLFTEFGPNSAKPIFTRRIGLNSDNRPVPINYGIRLSGNLTDNTRIGVLHLQTRESELDPGQNYSLAVFNQRVFSRSVIRGYATNRQDYTSSSNWFSEDYSRNTGLELNFLNKSGTWNYFSSYHLSSKSGIGIGTYGNLGVEYAGRNWKARVNYLDISSDYYADMGFIPRLEHYDAVQKETFHLGWKHLVARFGYVFRPGPASKVAAYDIEFRNSADYYPDGTLSDLETRLDYEVRFRNTGRLMVQPSYTKTNLIFATEFTDAEPLLPGLYSYPRINASYQSDSRKSFSFQSEVGFGQYYNGSLSRYLMQVNYRIQPWGTFSASWEQNILELLKPFGEENFILINTRAEVNFSNKIFWTTFLQYNTQRNNFNINSRLQYRYKSMSDIFLVYSDNYFTTFPISNSNRVIVLKFNYMFNL